MSEPIKAEEPQPSGLQYYHFFDKPFVEIHSTIDLLVTKYGWKDFVFAVLRYQKEKVKSNYQLLKSWL